MMDRAKMEEAVRSGQAFKLKDESEPEVVELTFDEMVEIALQLKNEKAALEKRAKEVRAVIKAEMAKRDVKTYETPTGTKVNLVDTQKTNYNKELLMELLGEDYTRCVKISKSVRFDIK